MQIRPSSALRNEYTQISELAKASGEPIFITNKGEDDGVYMSMAAYEEREKMFRHRDKIYAAENLCCGTQQIERRACLHAGGA